MFCDEPPPPAPPKPYTPTHSPGRGVCVVWAGRRQNLTVIHQITIDRIVVLSFLVIFLSVDDVDDDYDDVVLLLS